MLVRAFTYRDATCRRIVTKAVTGGCEGVLRMTDARSCTMLQREVEIVNKLGLHARASAKLTQLAAQFQSDMSAGAQRPQGQREEHHGRDDAGRRQGHQRRRSRPTGPTRKPGDGGATG